MIKTVKEYLENCPEPWAAEAFGYTNKETSADLASCLSEALVFAFTWNESDKGFEYWSAIYKDLRSRGL